MERLFCFPTKNFKPGIRKWLQYIFKLLFAEGGKIYSYILFIRCVCFQYFFFYNGWKNKIIILLKVKADVAACFCIVFQNPFASHTSFFRSWCII